ncbi:MAG: hypothetical protein HKN04_07375 [Rhodothermaceae bacterium]|nr:hypothetical protein [Rhodothermaceae bacterium]
MPTWYEVYDNQDVLLATRQRVRRITRIYGFAAIAVATLAPLAMVHVTGGAWLAGTAGVSLVVAGAYVFKALRELHAVAWSVKLSFHHIIGDFGRRRTTIRWRAVARVELDRDGLVILGADEQGVAQKLRIAHAFPDYPRLSHRVVEYAEAHGRPVYVDGQPWQLLDLHAVYPFLRDSVRES